MKQFFTLIIVLFVCLNFHAQTKPKSYHEKIRSARVSFISDQIALTSSQAEKFWPIYNNSKNEIYTLYKEVKDIQKNINFNTITEKESKTLFKELQSKENIINIKKVDFTTQLSKVISYKQILKLNNAENKFKKNLLERIKKEN